MGMGAPDGQVCGHRLVNCYCESDWVLAFVYRSSRHARTHTHTHQLLLNRADKPPPPPNRSPPYPRVALAACVSLHRARRCRRCWWAASRRGIPCGPVRPEEPPRPRCVPRRAPPRSLSIALLPLIPPPLPPSSRDMTQRPAAAASACGLKGGAGRGSLNMRVAGLMPIAADSDAAGAGGDKSGILENLNLTGAGPAPPRPLPAPGCATARARLGPAGAG